MVCNLPLSVGMLPNCSENKPMISLSTGACLREAASAKAGERVGVRGEHNIFTPTLILPHQGGG